MSLLNKFNKSNRLPSALDINYCKDCFSKQQSIDRLTQENQHLKQQLNYRQKQDKAGFFGSSTSSAKKPFKENSLASNQAKKGGAKPGHQGHGRKRIVEGACDESIDLSLAIQHCLECGGTLKRHGTILKGFIDSVLMKAKKVLYYCEKKVCTQCGKTFEAKPPVLPKSKYGNQLIANSLVMYFFHGIPLKRIEAIWGTPVVSGVLIKTFHRLAKFWEPAIQKLVEQYREHPVKHADETGWRTDGKSGYAWLFCTDNISLFTFRDTRSAKVPHEILGSRKTPGVLVVDRYAGYNRAPVKIQYCYAHLLRDLKKLEDEFSGDTEVQSFVSCFAPLMAEAMHLQTKPISDKEYYQRAYAMKEEMLKLIRAPARHPGIQSFQNIFRDKEDRMFHWVSNRNVPSHNNRSERELRPTVIARKVSFGSQSEAGAKTRSVLMSIMHTASKRLENQTIEEWFAWTLNQLLQNPKIDPCQLLPD